MEHVDKRGRGRQLDAIALLWPEQREVRARLTGEATRTAEFPEIHIERLLQLVRLVSRNRLCHVSPAPGQVEQRFRVQSGKRIRAEQAAHRVPRYGLAGEHH